MNHTSPAFAFPAEAGTQFTDPGGMEGWVGLGGRVAGSLHTEMSVQHRELNPDTVAYLTC